MKPPTFETAGRTWLAGLPTAIRRNGRPLSANTQRIYAGNFARLARHLGRERLPVTNSLLKTYVARMRSENYSPAQITSDLVVAKLVCESVADDDGNPHYPLKINHKFVATPIVNPDEQSAPVATREDVERALAVPEIAGIVCVAAGAGLRISEILALKIGGHVGDTWNASEGAIHIRETLKTPNAARVVYLFDELNAWLSKHTKEIAEGSPIFTTPRPELYRILSRHQLLPWHSYRRFFASHQSELMMNTLVLKTLMGHSRGAAKDTTARYTRARVDFIRSEVARVALGFTLPVASDLSKSSRSV
jgi:integrase